MMKLNRLVTIAVLGLALAMPLGESAQAADGGSGFGAGFYLGWSKTMLGGDSTAGISAGSSFAYGLDVTYALRPEWTLELDVLQNPVAYSDPTTSTSITRSSWNFPLLIRYTGIQYLSAGAGFEFQAASSSFTQSVAGGASTSTTLSGVPTTGFSIPIVVGGRYPIIDKVIGQLDVRYDLGLSNWNGTAGKSSTFSFLEVLAGASYSF